MVTLLQQILAGIIKLYHLLATVRTGIIETGARTLELPLPVRSSTFFFCLMPGAEAGGFRSALEPLSKRGNFRCLSTRFNYSSSYGSLGV